MDYVMLSWLGGGITVFVVFMLIMRRFFPPDTP